MQGNLVALMGNSGASLQAVADVNLLRISPVRQEQTETNPWDKVFAHGPRRTVGELLRQA